MRRRDLVPRSYFGFGTLPALGIFVVAILATSDAAAQDFAWAKRLGGASDESPSAITRDSAGNVYVTGWFTGTADFDPGPGTYEMTPDAWQEVFLVKLDPSGSFLWARRFAGDLYDNWSHSIATDSAGNVYLSGGYFNFPVEGSQRGRDRRVGTTAPEGDPFIIDHDFIAKVDPSGHTLWYRVTVFDDGGSHSMALDGAGNVYLTGAFRGGVYFYPSSGGSCPLGSVGNSYDVFVGKLDTSTGNCLWAKSMGGTSDDVGQAIAVDAAGNVTILGSFVGPADFDPGPGTYNLSSGPVFISRFDANGLFGWAKAISKSISIPARAIASDGSGGFHVACGFTGTGDFDPGPGVSNLTSAGDYDVAVLEFSATGELVWAKRMGGTGAETPAAIALDGAGHVYTSGTFSGMSDFDPGTGVSSLTSYSGSSDIFVSKLDGDGNFRSVMQLGGPASEAYPSLTTEGAGDVLVAGGFSGVADFDPHPGSYPLTSAGAYDVFVASYSSPGAGATPDGASVPGVPMTIGKAGGTLLSFAWGASCQPDGADYELYEGVLGSFASHEPLLCSSGGNTSGVLSVSDGDRYYLVVPTTGTLEGSYGRDRAGVERPASALACVPQSLGSCP